MQSQADTLPLLAYARMVRHRWIVVAVATLGMTIPALVVSWLQPKTYQATAEVLLGAQQVDGDLNIRTIDLTDRQVNSQVAILTGDQVAEAAREGGATTPVRAVSAANSNVIVLAVEDSEAQRATDSLNAYIQAYSEYRVGEAQKSLDAALDQFSTRMQQLTEQAAAASDPQARADFQAQQVALQTQLSQLQVQRSLVASNLVVVQPPVVPDSPISPQPFRNAALALALGVFLGISVAILLETSRQRSRPSGDQASTDQGRTNNGIVDAEVPRRGGAPVRVGQRAPQTINNPAAPTEALGSTSSRGTERINEMPAEGARFPAAPRPHNQVHRPQPRPPAPPRT